MKRYLSKQELKEVQLGILKYIDQICKKHQIRYFVNYGTLLGSVRHQGFIPWDDDIDISMYREDYERFIAVVEDDHHVRYEILSHHNSDWYFQNFCVVLDTTTGLEDHFKVKPHETSVFVDVFPIDTFDDKTLVDKTLLMQKLKLISYIKLPYVQYGDSRFKDLCRKLMWYCLRPVKPNFFAHQIDRYLKKYVTKDGRYEGCIGCSKDGMKEVFPRGTFAELIELPFENMLVPAPKEYDRFLSQFYGDYMTPPNQQAIDDKSHQLNAYWK